MTNKSSIWLVVLLLVSCYNSQKATKQFGRAAATYPSIPANYCAITYPPIVGPGKHDTVTVTDSVTIPGNVVSDTTVSHDTVRITKTKWLPGKVMTKIVHVTDSIPVENTSRLKACELERGKTLDLLGAANTRADKFEGKSKTRGLLLLSFLLALLLSLFFNLRSLFK